MRSRYERQTYQFLSVFRFIAYALAVMFIQVSAEVRSLNLSEDYVYIILIALGVYTLLRFFSPLRWHARSHITYVILIGDFIICILIVIFTNGLNSSFLLYSLTPIMTAALFFEERVALSLAVASTIALALIHLFVNTGNQAMAILMMGQNLTLLIIYCLFSFVIALVPYRINLNIRRRIERDAILEERRRIGREIHDGVAQTISFLNLKTKIVRDSLSASNMQKASEGLDEIKVIAQNTYEDIREAIDQLSTETKNLPLVTTLNNYVRQFGDKNHIVTRFQASRPFPQLSPVAELQLLRIAQEALTNVRRHAQAFSVEISLNNHDKFMEMTVKDDGHGFVVSEAGGPEQGYHGLSIIKERAEGLGGKVEVSSEPGKGTEVKVSLPIEKMRM